MDKGQVGNALRYSISAADRCAGRDELCHVFWSRLVDATLVRFDEARSS